MRKDITKKINSFLRQSQEDNHHRYMSWEHCYEYFKRDPIDIDIDKACLHLAFYLASWGMYRGSSFLLQKDYLIHKEVVEHLITKRHLRNIEFVSINDELQYKEETINEIIQLCAWIKEWYATNVKKVNGVDKKVNATDTLVTKIVLGALGCVPAYDRYFIDGLRAHSIKPYRPTSNGINKLVSFYVHNINQFNAISSQRKIDRKIIYPPMKLIDMYFWQIGYDEDQKDV